MSGRFAQQVFRPQDVLENRPRVGMINRTQENLALVDEHEDPLVVAVRGVDPVGKDMVAHSRLGFGDLLEAFAHDTQRVGCHRLGNHAVPPPVHVTLELQWIARGSGEVPFVPEDVTLVAHWSLPVPFRSFGHCHGRLRRRSRDAGRQR